MRWKAVIPISIILIGICVSVFLFGNLIVKGTIEKIGSSIVGAKVEISKLKLSLSKLSIEIRGLQVTNPSDCWKNLFEVKKIRFALTPGALLSKKIVIDEMSVANIAYGTKRESSGRLRKKVKKPSKKKKPSGKPTFFGSGKKMLTKEFTKLPISDMESLKKKVDVKKIVDIENLESMKHINSLKNDIRTKSEYWDNTLKRLKTADEINRIGNRVKEINIEEVKQIKDIRDIDKIKQKAEEVKSIKRSLETIKGDIDKKQKRLNSDFAGMTTKFNEIDRIRKNDYKMLMNKVQGGVNTQSIAKTLFGPIWVERVNTGLYWLDKARKYMPKKSPDKPEKPKKQRAKGMYVSFPRKNSYPSFLLREMFISIDKKEEADVSSGGYFKGKVEGVTSNPSLYGKPTLIDIQRTDPRISFKGVLDHTTDDAKDNFNLTFLDADMSGFEIGDNPLFPPRVSKGKADIKINLSIEKDYLDMGFNADLRNIKFSSKDTAGGTRPEPVEGTRPEPVEGATSWLAKELAGVMSKADKITLEGRIYGPGDKLKIKIKSNLDTLLSARINQLVGEQLKETGAKIRSEVDSIIEGERKNVLDSINSKKKEVTGILDIHQKQVQKNIDTAKAKIAEIEKVVAERTAREKQKIEQEKKKLEEEKKKKEQELKDKMDEELKKKLKKLF
jgi:uncharacterized protein (TIGR03545 family)